VLHQPHGGDLAGFATGMLVALILQGSRFIDQERLSCPN